MDKDALLVAVQQDGRALEGACETLRGDKDVVLAAVQQNGPVLRFASEELRGDKDLVLAAVKNDGRALRFASEELRGDKDLVLTAVQQNVMAVDFASEELRGDKEIRNASDPAKLYDAVIHQKCSEVERLLGSGARLSSDRVESVKSMISDRFDSASKAMDGGDINWGYEDQAKAQKMQELLQKCLEAGN